MLCRCLERLVREDLDKKMVFLGGPPQVGNTTLAHMVAEEAKRPAYFNWDRRAHRRAILQEQWPSESDLLVFDELHKYEKWKSWIKGVWDTRPQGTRLLVTGSSRLDIFRRGGDSLQGRYHYYRLHPFSLAEIHASGRLSRPKNRRADSPGREIFDGVGVRLRLEMRNAKPPHLLYRRVALRCAGGAGEL